MSYANAAFHRRQSPGARPHAGFATAGSILVPTSVEPKNVSPLMPEHELVRVLIARLQSGSSANEPPAR